MPYSFVSYISCCCHHLDDDADVYAVDFHVIFAEEELQGSTANGDQGTCNEWIFLVSAALGFQSSCKCFTSDFSLICPSS